MNFVQLSDLVHDKQSSVLFLKQRGILHNPRMCGNCNARMHLSLRDKGGDRWRCHIRGCRSEFGLRKDICSDGLEGGERRFVNKVYLCWRLADWRTGRLAKRIHRWPGRFRGNPLYQWPGENKKSQWGFRKNLGGEWGAIFTLPGWAGRRL